MNSSRNRSNISRPPCSFFELRLQPLFMPSDKDKEREAVKKDRVAADCAESQLPNEAGDIDSYRLDTRQKVRNSLPSLLAIVICRTPFAFAPSPFCGEKGPSNRKECRVPGNRPNISVYIEALRYKRQKSGIQVIPIFRDRCI